MHSLNDTLEGLQGYVAQVGESVGNVQLPLAMLNRYMREESVFAAYRDLFLLGGILSVVTLIPVCLLSGRRDVP